MIDIAESVRQGFFDPKVLADEELYREERNLLTARRLTAVA